MIRPKRRPTKSPPEDFRDVAAVSRSRDIWGHSLPYELNDYPRGFEQKDYNSLSMGEKKAPGTEDEMTTEMGTERSPKSFMPRGGNLSPRGDLGALRQKETGNVFKKPIKNAGKNIRSAEYFRG